MTSTSSIWDGKEEMKIESNFSRSSLQHDGDELKQIWHPGFVVFAYLIAFLSSYTAVHLLDHHLWFWRSEELKRAAILKHPDIYAGCMLAVGTVWCMHFVGMAAVTLEGTAICYDWSITMGSLAAVLVLMIAGIKVAGHDVFATPDRDGILDEILRSKYGPNRDERHNFYVKTFHKLHFLTIGSFLAASGAVVMHYTGMMAQRGSFRREWNIWLIAASIITAIIICFVGFWIIFRLRWKIEQLWLRYASAAAIALAVCGLHFFGMVSVRYFVDTESTGICRNNEKSSPTAWTIHQIIVFAIAIAVLAINFMMESAINQELLIAYEGAAQSSVIVASLFPAKFRDRLFDGKKRVQGFLSRSDDNGESSHTGDTPHDDDDDNFDIESQSDPIADLFPNTTILFMDLVGFTKWSSTRDPAQVFILLETLYQACDRIAARRKVFKIETIGDCYVAATGLPSPQPDHAVIMSKFARDCQYRMSQILSGKLREKLGEDIQELGFRVGMHSGPITGGVLRGQKARFQLFGDTMNTASRMESNGVKGRIHVSEETANELIAQQMDHWLTPREGLIEVKGKGWMQTYFVEMTKSKTSETRSNLSSIHDSDDASN